ncbi:MAG TPA: GyrI-like domain-containing protein [Acidobacteriota bacterium]|nr:GyrI-like domain-containing protein [Acidobacteriota bacterium]HQM62849.1 GyrI-like domain-containing protein [Acidobacteriota bacterium]
MPKIDYRKKLKSLYSPSAQSVVQVEVPPQSYLMVDGAGDPNGSPEFAAAVEALFAVAYTVKFMVKKGPLAVDYGVLPLEGLWWADDMARFSIHDKSHWQWTLMIMQPDLVTGELVERAMAEVRRKKAPAAIDRLRFEVLAEGACAQILHVGPFSEEGVAVEKVHRHIESLGRRPAGKHHEIYLSDIRKAAPAKWKTIIRQPMS